MRCKNHQEKKWSTMSDVGEYLYFDAIRERDEAREKLKKILSLCQKTNDDHITFAGIRHQDALAALGAIEALAAAVREVA
jgi:hypothetical protein